METNNADYKLGDIYPGFSRNNTREKSIPDSADMQVTAGSEQNTQATEVADVVTTNTNKKGILIAVGVIAVLAVVLGSVR